MIERIKKKWEIENNFQFIIILVVFAVTGSVSAMVSGPIAEFFELDSLHVILYWPLRLLIVFPVYQILLVWFGFVFGIIISIVTCLLYTSPSPRDMRRSRMPSSA